MTSRVKPDTLGGRNPSFFIAMEEILTLPQSLYVFRSSKNILDNTLEQVKQLEWKRNAKNEISTNLFLHKEDNFKEVSEWIRECVLEVVSKIQYVCEDFKIIQMWATKTTFQEWHHPHHHNNSVISAIYYLTDSNSHTWFSIPSIWDDEIVNKNSPLRLCYEEEDKSLRPVHKQPTEAGTLIIFPSHLHHSVNEHLMDPDPRYTIAVNLFPSGRIGKYEYYSGLTIHID